MWRILRRRDKKPDSRIGRDELTNDVANLHADNEHEVKSHFH